MTPTYRDDPAGNMADLAERLRRAEAELRDLATARGIEFERAETTRLLAKRQGVVLALDYLRAYEDQQ